MRILSVFTMDAASMQPPSQEKIDRMGQLIEEMRSKGALVDTGGVMPGSLELKVERKNGNCAVTDGPFTESKEEAIEWTRRFLDVAGEATCHLHEVSTV